MAAHRRPAPPDLAVLLVHNLSHDWEEEELRLACHDASLIETGLRQKGHEVVTVAVREANLSACLRDYSPEQLVVFNWCEELPGVPHSEALVARCLEELGFTFTGSPARVLALSWDKPLVKRRLQSNGVPTPAWCLIESCGSVATSTWRRYPAIVKPAHEHCSLGLTSEAVVVSPQELSRRVGYVLESFDQPALVEDFIDGREFHVPVWGNGKVEVLPAAEMDFSAFKKIQDRLCTFDSKFRPGSTHYDKIKVEVPAPLTAREKSLLEQTARAAYRALECRDYARLDLRLRDGIFYVLDVNPNADISYETSMASAAEAAGHSYGAMLARLVALASERHPSRRARRRSVVDRALPAREAIRRPSPTV